MTARIRNVHIRWWHVVAAWLVIYFPWLPGSLFLKYLPWLPSTPHEFVIDANLAGQYALVAISLVILTGWVGQISLGQGAFVGVAAFTTGLLSREFGIPFPLNLPLVACLTAGVAALLGTVALRVRGLYLAVATLIFAWSADAFLFTQSWFVGSGGSSSIENRPIGRTDSVTLFDLSNPNTLYLVILAAVAIAWFVAVSIRDSKTGRAFFAVRGSEMAAVSLGIDVRRYKLIAFAISGALAGIAGNLMMIDLRVVTPTQFQFTVSLFYLGIAVVGGIASLGGAIGAGVLFAALTEVFFRVEALQGWLDVVTIALLLGVLLGYPAGLGGLGTAGRRRLVALIRTTRIQWRRFRRFIRANLYGRSGAHADAVDPRAGRSAPQTASRHRKRFLRRWRRGSQPKPKERLVPLEERARGRLQPTAEEQAILDARSIEADWRTCDTSGFVLPTDRSDRSPVLAAEDITVRFGGLTAVDEVSLEVREREIVGLIGPNGAGKTTTFNAVAGLNEPAEGSVSLFEVDVSGEPVHIRAQYGMGRTFQLIQLFDELTVFDNLLVGTHMQNSTGLFSHVALTDRAILEEAKGRSRVRLVIEMLGLEDVSDRPVAGLPFGMLRQIEIGRALVTGSPLLMLDEPASGLDNAETDELAQLLRFLRAELGLTILLIEHDVRLVTAVTDYIYVLNQGRLLAEGTPDEIQRDPAVVAAYLGQSADDEAATEELETV